MLTSGAESGLVGVVRSAVSGVSGGSDEQLSLTVDSGASCHISYRRDLLIHVESIAAVTVKLGDGSSVQATERGCLPVMFRTDSGLMPVLLMDVLCVPDLAYNLLSVSAMSRRGGGVTVHFDGAVCCICRHGHVIGRASQTSSRLYELTVDLPPSSSLPPAAKHCTGESMSSTRQGGETQHNMHHYSATVPMALVASGRNKSTDSHDYIMSDAELWHRRLGHLSQSGMQVLASSGMVTGMPAGLSAANGCAFADCEACAMGKSHRAPMPQAATTRATKPLELIHTDVCGPMPVPSLSGSLYFVTFIDDYTRFVVVRPIRHKSDVLLELRNYVAFAEKQTGEKVKAIRSDGGGEYNSDAFDAYLLEHGIARQRTPPYTPEHNGVAERANRTLLEMVRSMLSDSGLPDWLWAEAVATAGYYRNRSPTRAISVANKTPFELFTGHKPDLSLLRIWGCRCYVLIPPVHRSKLDDKATVCAMIGYSAHSKAYRVLDLATREVYVSRNVTFVEHQRAAAASRPATEPTAVVPQLPSSASDQAASLEWEQHHHHPAGRHQQVERKDSLPEHHHLPAAAAGHGQRQLQRPPVRPPVVQEQQPPYEHPLNDDETEAIFEEPAVVAAPNRQQLVAAADDNNVNDERPAHRRPVPPPVVRRTGRARVPPQPYWVASDNEKQELIQEQQQAQRNHHLLMASSAGGGGDGGSDTSCSSSAPVAADDDEPASFRAAMLSANAKQWEHATDSEYDSLQKAGTYELVRLPPGRSPIGCKWVLKVKRGADGQVERYKARLVAQGFSQKAGIDYTDTFAPVAKFVSIRALLAIGAHFDLHMHQMDVKTAFLNGELDEEIYMRQPEGYAVQGSEHLVCRLRKSLYGLKQAGRAWYQRIDTVLVQQLGFTRLHADHCVYISHQSSSSSSSKNDSSIMYIALYVDDLLLLASHADKLTRIKQQLCGTFDMKDLGELHFLLGLQIRRDRRAGTLLVSQEEYVRRVVDRFGMTSSKAIGTPLDPRQQLTKLDCPTTQDDIERDGGSTIPVRSRRDHVCHARYAA